MTHTQRVGAVQTITAPPMMPGMELLGRGIDVRGEAFPTNAPEIFDLGPEEEINAPNQKPYLLPAGARLIDWRITADGTSVAASSAEYQRQYSASLGLSGMYEGFSGSFNSTFKYSETTFESTYYAFTYGQYQAWGVSLNERAVVEASVLEKMQAYAEDDHWEKLFNEFGTHYVGTVAVGGRYSIVASAEKSAALTTTSISAAIEAKYEMFFSSKATFDASGLDQTFESSSKCQYVAVGGDPALQNSIRTTPGDGGQWIDSTWQNPQLINYQIAPPQGATPLAVPEGASSAALVEIWTLLDRRYWASAKAAFERLIKSETAVFLAVGASYRSESDKGYGSIKINNVEYFTNNTTPSLTICVFNLADLTLIAAKSFDYLHQPQSAGKEMCTMLDTYSKGEYLVFVASGDSGWNRSTNIDGGLIALLESFGANGAQLLGTRQWREPFVLVGRSAKQRGTPGNGYSLRGPSQGQDVAIRGTLLKAPSDSAYRICIDSIVGGSS